MKNSMPVIVAKYAVYTLLLLLLYTLQTTPGLLVLFGAKPMLAVSAAISFAMLEGEFVGGIYGALAGLLCDLGSKMLFGFYGLFLSLFCIAAGLMVIYLIHCNAGGAVLFVFASMMILGGIEFLFGYGMWGYENVWMVYVYQILPVTIYTTVATFPVFRLIQLIFLRFQKALAK